MRADVRQKAAARRRKDSLSNYKPVTKSRRNPLPLNRTGPCVLPFSDVKTKETARDRGVTLRRRKRLLQGVKERPLHQPGDIKADRY
jgi:hypothetical protein